MKSVSNSVISEIDYTITTITLFVKLNCTFNIHNFEYIFPKDSKKFLNSFIVNLYIDECEKYINIKIFENGSLHLTGLKKVEDYLKVVSELHNKLKQFEHQIVKIVLSKDSNGIYTDSEQRVYDKNGKTMIGYKTNDWYYIFNKKCRYFKDIGKFKNLQGLVILSNVVDGSSPSALIVDYNINPYKSDINKLEIIDFDINTINVKTTVSTKFSNKSFYNWLTDNQFFVEYNPERYSGLKLKINIDQSDTLLKKCKCNNKCVCTIITFLIFSTGNVLITNLKKESIIKIALNYFQKIVLFYNNNSDARLEF